MVLYGELENNENLDIFLKVMDKGGYSYDYVLKNYLIPKARDISEKLDDVLHSERLFPDHDILTNYILDLLEEDNPKENIEYWLGIIDLEENYDLHAKRIKEKYLDIFEGQTIN